MKLLRIVMKTKKILCTMMLKQAQQVVTNQVQHEQ